MKIKALTLWQPWATLIAMRAKTYETRSWQTEYRGLLAIHAAKRKPEEFPAAGRALARHGIGAYDMLPLGAVVCIVRLVDILPTQEIVKVAVRSWSGRELDEMEFGDYREGRFAWKLEHVCSWLIPARGKQGLWDWTVPDRLQHLLKGKVKHDPT